MNEIPNTQYISFVTTCDDTGISRTSDVIPKTPSILKILDPIKFPTEISVSFLRAAIIDVISSGTLVPKATIVTPITCSLTPKFEAICTAPPNNHFAPKAKPMEPIINGMRG